MFGRAPRIEPGSLEATRAALAAATDAPLVVVDRRRRHRPRGRRCAPRSRDTPLAIVPARHRQRPCRRPRHPVASSRLSTPSGPAVLGGWTSVGLAGGRPIDDRRLRRGPQERHLHGRLRDGPRRPDHGRGRERVEAPSQVRGVRRRRGPRARHGSRPRGSGSWPTARRSRSSATWCSSPMRASWSRPDRSAPADRSDERPARADRPRRGRSADGASRCRRS